MNWLPKNSIVVPTDLSDFSLKALDVAAAMVQDSSHIHLVYVLRDISVMEPGVVWGDVDEETRRRRVDEAIREKISKEKYPDITIAITLGTPSTQIAKYAEKVGADLIVMHSHGRTGASHILIGSTAERVVRHAHCPVLVIRE